MEDGSIITKLLKEHEITNQFSVQELLAIEKISSETFKEMMKDQHSLKNTFQDKYLGLGLEIKSSDDSDKKESNKGPGFKPEDLSKIYGKVPPEPSSLYPRILMQQKLNTNKNDVFKSKLPAINKYLKDMVDYSNFIIDDGIVKMDSKTMSSRRRNLEQMITDHNMKLQRKYGFDISTYRDIDIDKVIKYLIDYPPIESGSITTTKSTTKNDKGIVHLKFDKSLDDKDDIGHLFDFRTFVKPHLILLLINYMTIKFKTSSNLTLSNIYISARQSYVYGNLVDRFFVVFEFDKIDNDGEFVHGPYLKFEFDKTKSKLKAVSKTSKTKKSKSPHYNLKSRE